MADNRTEHNDLIIMPSAEAEESYLVDEATDEVLRLHLDGFEGPFEVLLYLIKAQEIDIFDIPIATITDQYLGFLDMMREENLDVVGDFLVMAATLIQIKSKMLLPVELDTDEDDIEEDDPRLELVEKLLEYRKYRDMAARLERLELERTNWFARNVKPTIEYEGEDEYIEADMFDLIQAFKGVLRFVADDLIHPVENERYSVDEKIAFIEDLLAKQKSVAWRDLFVACRSKLELVCSFLAILELCRMGHIRVHQHRSFDEIRLVATTGEAG